MPAARYWRLVGIETYAGSDMELSELHLYDASGRVDATATLTSAVAPVAGALSALQDGDLATACRFAGAAVRSGGFALVWDFGAGNTADAIGVRPGAAGDVGTFLALCALQYSTDGVLWQTYGAYGRFEWPGAWQYTLPPVVGDKDYEKVVLLLHFAGVNGSTTFNDSSTSAKTATVNGNAKISTAQSKFGGSSAFFDGSDDDLTYASVADFGFGLGDWTWEAFVLRQNSDCALFDNRVSGSDTASLVAYVSATGYLSWYDGSTKISTTNLIAASEWVHVAYCRKDGLLSMFVGGALTRSDPKTSDMGSARPMRIGRDVVNNADFMGYLAEVRITRGVARYTANFTPPAEPFPDSVVGAGGTVFVAPYLHSNAPVRPIVAASAPVPPHSTRLAAPMQRARDIEVGGPGTIYGTTKTKGAPNQPAKARVVLLHQRSKLPVRETWSDPITGAFVFEGIDTTQQFLTLAEDAAGNFRPVAASRLVPEVAP